MRKQRIYVIKNNGEHLHEDFRNYAVFEAQKFLFKNEGYFVSQKIIRRVQDLMEKNDLKYLLTSELVLNCTVDGFHGLIGFGSADVHPCCNILTSEEHNCKASRIKTPTTK